MVPKKTSSFRSLHYISQACPFYLVNMCIVQASWKSLHLKIKIQDLEII